MALKAAEFRALANTAENDPRYRRRVSLAEVAKLTGLDEDSVLQYERAGVLERSEGRDRPGLFPAVGADRCWAAGHIAVWVASRPYKGRRLVPPPRPARKHPRQRKKAPAKRISVDALNRATARLLRDPDPPATAEALRLRLAEQGMRVSWERCRDALLAVRSDPGPCPSTREDGLVYGEQLAVHYRVAKTSISGNVNKGRLTWVRREKAPGGPGQYTLFDPALVVSPGWPLRAPVDRHWDRRSTG